MHSTAHKPIDSASPAEIATVSAKQGMPSSASRQTAWPSLERQAFIRWVVRHPLRALGLAADLWRVVKQKAESTFLARWSKPHLFRRHPSFFSKGMELAPYPDEQSHVAKPADPLKQRCTFDVNDSLRQSPKSVANLESEDVEQQHRANRWAWMVDIAGKQLAPKGAVLDQVQLWLATPPDSADLSWEPYSASERVSNLLTWYRLTDETLSDGEHRQLVQWLIRHTRWIITHLEYSNDRDTNNHIINNARALVMAASLLRWEAPLKVAARILQHMLPMLVGSDGFMRERSSHYQLIFAGWLLDIQSSSQLWPQAEQLLHPLVDSLIAKLLRGCHLLISPHQTLHSRIGDISPDCSIDESVAKLSDLYYQQWEHGTSRELLQRDDWIVSRQGHGKVLCNFPTRPLPLRFVNHGHCDITSFEWTAANAPILVDLGRRDYSSHEVSVSQIGPGGHNLMTVDGLAPVASSFVSFTDLRPKPYASANLEITCSQEPDRNVITMHSDGYERLERGMLYQRTIEHQPTSLTVRDSVTSSQLRTFRWHWHFSKLLSVIDVNSECWRATLAGAQLRVRLTIECKMLPTSNFQFGVEDAVATDDYGTSHNVARISFNGHCKGSIQVVSRFEVEECVE